MRFPSARILILVTSFVLFANEPGASAALYGGEGVEFSTDFRSGAKYRFGCGEGSIDHSLYVRVLKASFEESGTLTVTGGPGSDRRPTTHPAWYFGRFAGASLFLNVVYLVEGKPVVTPSVLRLGARGQIGNCVPDQGALAAGEYGGNHLQIQVRDPRSFQPGPFVQFQFDCAHGYLKGDSIHVSQNGAFFEAGTYVHSQEGTAPKEYPVRYFGFIHRGDSILLSIDFAGSGYPGGEPINSHLAVRGRRAELNRCVRKIADPTTDGRSELGSLHKKRKSQGAEIPGIRIAKTGSLPPTTLK